VPTQFAVAYEDEERQVFLRARDVSEQGIFLFAPDPPGSGVAATLVLELPGKLGMVRVHATVCRFERSPRSGFALRFDLERMEDAARRALRGYVEGALASDLPARG
jgi:hypothetical protein